MLELTVEGLAAVSVAAFLTVILLPLCYCCCRHLCCGLYQQAARVGRALVHAPARASSRARRRGQPSAAAVLSGRRPAGGRRSRFVDPDPRARRAYYGQGYHQVGGHEVLPYEWV